MYNKATLKPVNHEQAGKTNHESAPTQKHSSDHVPTSNEIIDLVEDEVTEGKDLSKALVKLGSLSLVVEDAQTTPGKRKARSPTPYPVKRTTREETSEGNTFQEQEQIPFDEETTSMPEAITILRSISPTLKTPVLGEYFDRVTIEVALGGNIDNMFSSTNTAEQEQAFPCPYYVATRVDSNPWEPRDCGDHGCLLHPFSTVYKIEDHLLCTVFSLFLKRGLDTWEYMGEYRQPYPPKRLSLAGQRGLFKKDHDLLNKWTKVVADGTENHFMIRRSARYSRMETVRNRLQEGHGSVTVWRFFVECVGYKRDFYDALITLKRAHDIEGSASTKSTDTVVLSDSEQEIDQDDGSS